MPRPKVWGDFEEDEGFAAKDDAGDDLVEFTCPYNCGKPIRMKARNVIKNKCTECRSHLLKCSGAVSCGGGRRAAGRRTWWTAADDDDDDDGGAPTTLQSGQTPNP